MCVHREAEASEIMHQPVLTDQTEAGGLKDEILSGLTVALALVPEAVAFAFVAGVPPIVGLYGALLMGLITSLIGGRPGIISGATGAMAIAHTQ